MNIDFKETWVVLWSKKQKCFHVDTLHMNLRANWDVFFETNPHGSDYILMGLADSIKEANQVVARLEKAKMVYLDTGEFPEEFGKPE